MTTTTKSSARLHFRLSPDLKEIIEEAALRLGQSISDFAISTLVRNARSVLEDSQRTELSNRDRDIFMATVDDTGAKPSRKLMAAAKKYKKLLR